MHNEEFEAPATHWVVLTVVGGLLTGLGLIAGLEHLRDRIPHASPTSSNSIDLPYIQTIQRTNLS